MSALSLSHHVFMMKTVTDRGVDRKDQVVSHAFNMWIFSLCWDLAMCRYVK